MHYIILFFKFFFKFLGFERDTARAGEEQRERIPGRPCAISAEPDAGLEPTNREIKT